MTNAFTLSRRRFLAGAGAVFGLGAAGLPLEASEGGAPLLRLGVLSDIHLEGRRVAPERLEFALRWLEARGVEAVLSPGDIAHLGRVHQLEMFAKIWQKVFPNNRARDGRTVELMISMGNHDAWLSGMAKRPEEEKRADWLMYGDNLARAWDRLFGEIWSPVWRKEVKGFTFIGAHWETTKPDIEGYMAAHGKELDPARPFFYCQHAHPQGTCNRLLSKSAGTFDKGASVRALSPFPNAVAFSGHSHHSIATDHAVWQGAFTSINAGCLHEGGFSFQYENGCAFWHKSYKEHLNGPLNDPQEAWGGDPEGGCFLFVEVFADRLLIHRRSSVYDLAVGPDWTVPLPAKVGGPFEMARLTAGAVAPEFPAGARIAVEVCPQGNPAFSTPAHRADPCVHLTIPCANAKGRVYDYVVTARADGRDVKTWKFVANGFCNPPEKSARETHALVALAELPKGTGVTFSVTPRESCGNAGRAVVSAPVVLTERA